MKRGEIWLADLNPRRGTEPGKTRPVLVVQSQALLDARTAYRPDPTRWESDFTRRKP